MRGARSRRTASSVTTRREGQAYCWLSSASRGARAAPRESAQAAAAAVAAARAAPAGARPRARLRRPSRRSGRTRRTRTRPSSGPSVDRARARASATSDSHGITRRTIATVQFLNGTAGREGDARGEPRARPDAGRGRAARRRADSIRAVAAVRHRVHRRRAPLRRARGSTLPTSAASALFRPLPPRVARAGRARAGALGRCRCQTAAGIIARTLDLDVPRTIALTVLGLVRARAAIPGTRRSSKRARARGADRRGPARRARRRGARRGRTGSRDDPTTVERRDGRGVRARRRAPVAVVRR